MKNRLFLAAITITINCSHLLSNTVIANDEFFEDEDFLKLITEVEEKGGKKSSRAASSMGQTELNTLVLPEEASNDKDTPFKHVGSPSVNQESAGKESATKKLFDRVGKLFTNDPFAKEQKSVAKPEQKPDMKHFTLDGPEIESSRAISRKNSVTQNASTIKNVEDLRKVTLPNVPKVKDVEKAPAGVAVSAKIEDGKKQRAESVEKAKTNKPNPVKVKKIPEANEILPKAIVHEKAEIKIKDKSVSTAVEPAFENKGRASEVAKVETPAQLDDKNSLASELDISTLPTEKTQLDERKALGDNVDLKASAFDLELPKIEEQTEKDTQSSIKEQAEEKKGVFAKIGGFLKGFFEEEDEIMHEEDMELKALEERLLREIEEEHKKTSDLRSRAKPSNKVQPKSNIAKDAELKDNHVPSLEAFDPKSFETATEDQQLRQLVEDDMTQALEIPREDVEVDLPQLQIQGEKPTAPEQPAPREDRQVLLPRKPKPVIEKNLPSIDEMDRAKSLGTTSADEMFGITNKPKKLEPAGTVFDYWQKNKDVFTKPFATNKQQGIDAADNIYKLDVPIDASTKSVGAAVEHNNIQSTQKEKNVLKIIEETNDNAKSMGSVPQQQEDLGVDTGDLTKDLLEDEFFRKEIAAREQQRKEASDLSKPMVEARRKVATKAEDEAKPVQKAVIKPIVRDEKRGEAIKPTPFKDVSEVLTTEDPVEDRSIPLTTGSNIEDISEVIKNDDDIEDIFDDNEALAAAEREIKDQDDDADVIPDDLDGGPNETLLSPEAAAKAEELSPIKHGSDGDGEPEDIEAIEDGAYSLYADEVLPTYLEGVKNRGKYSYEQDVTENPIYRKQYGEKNQHLPPVADVADYTRYLFYAAYENNIEAMKSLVDRGADINAQDENTGYTPAMVALIAGKKDAVAYLMNIGADANIRDNSGNSLLQRALLKQDLDSYKLILKVAPRVSKAVIRQSLETMVENGYAQEWAQPLVEFMGGADTMLIQFAKVNDYYGVRLAVNAGADLQVVDSSNGLSVFEYAVINQNVMMLEELYEADPEGFMAMRDRLRSMAYRSNNSQFKVAFENMLVTIEMQQGAR
jgi:hypothetical protein